MLFEDRFQTTISVQPFYNADDSFKCYAILTLSMNPVELSEYGRAIKNKPHSFKNGSRENEIDPAYKLRLLMVEKESLRHPACGEHPDLFNDDLQHSKRQNEEAPAFNRTFDCSGAWCDAKGNMGRIAFWGELRRVEI